MLPWILLALAMMAFALMLNHEAVDLQGKLIEYENNEVLRLMDECDRCRLNEESNWKDASIRWREDLEACEAKVKVMERDWHPAHITPHTKEACEKYACVKCPEE